MKRYFVTNEKEIRNAGYETEKILGLVLDCEDDIEDKEIEIGDKEVYFLIPLKDVFGDSYRDVSGISDMIRCKVTNNKEIFTMAYEVKKEENKIEKKKSKMLEVFKLRNSIKKMDEVKFIK